MLLLFGYVLGAHWRSMAPADNLLLQSKYSKGMIINTSLVVIDY